MHAHGTTCSSSARTAPLGRDEFLRLLYGAQVSLEVAVLSTIGAMFIGVVMGSIAGYFRGWVDTVISRMIEITMAFPALLFIIALARHRRRRSSNSITFGFFAQGVITLVLIFTLFGWFYPARIIRARSSRSVRRSSSRRRG